MAHCVTNAALKELEVYNAEGNDIGQRFRFDNADWYKSHYGTGISDVGASLSWNAFDANYRDINGNMPTSCLRNPRKDK